MTDVAVAWDTDWVFPDGSTAARGFTSGLPTALLVTEDGGLSTGNAYLRDLLVANDYEVLVRPWNDPEDYVGVDVVVLSVGNPPGDTGRFLSPPVGIVAVDSWRRVGMGTDLGYENDVNSVQVQDAASPLAAEVTGTFAPYLSAAFITWETNLAASPDVVVSRPSAASQAVVFAFEAGDTMPTRYATTRHVALGYHEDGLAGGLSDEGRAQLLAAVSWAADSTVVGLSAPAAPSGVSASAGDGRVTVSWAATASATSYTVKRALVTGGPYSDVETGITGTSYADTTTTNDTEYFYVVSASNSEGESSDSAEVSATPTASATTNLRLLVTSDEIATWQTRKVSGPFRVAGDFSTNSPGHWNEMVSDASYNWAADRWSGPTNLDGAKVRKGGSAGNDPPGAVQRVFPRMMGAAYVAVTNNDAVLAQQVVDELRWYTQQSRLDFANRTLWPYGYYSDINPLFMICLMLVPAVTAYDACRHLVGPDEAVEQWFADLAYLADNETQLWLLSTFPNRNSDSYTSRASYVDSTVLASSRLSSGNIVYHLRVSQAYNNRRQDMAAFAGMVGLLLDDTYLVGVAKRFWREWVMFANRTTANQWTCGDHDRGRDDQPQLGLSYDLMSLGRGLHFIEALARTGDTSLYDFSSSEGSAEPTWGSDHSKTMKQCLEQRIDIVNGTITAQYTGSGLPPSASVAGNERFRIKSRNENLSPAREMVTDGMLLLAADYYGEPSWVDVINRVGTPTGFTAPPQQAGATTGWLVSHRARFLRDGGV